MPDDKALTAKDRRSRLVKERHERRKSVEQLMLSGATSVRELAERFGVSQSTIRCDMQAIEKRWIIADKRSSEQKRALRLKQLSQQIMRAAVSYDRSMNETTITRTRKYFDKSGQERTDTTVERRSSSGEPAWLQVIIKGICESAKLEGLYADGVNVNVAGDINVGLNPPEDLLKRMEALSTEELIAIAKATEPLARIPETVDAIGYEQGNGHKGNGHAKEGE